MLNDYECYHLVNCIFVHNYYPLYFLYFSWYITYQHQSTQKLKYILLSIFIAFTNILICWFWWWKCVVSTPLHLFENLPQILQLHKRKKGFGKRIILRAVRNWFKESTTVVLLGACFVYYIKLTITTTTVSSVLNLTHLFRKIHRQKLPIIISLTDFFILCKVL